MDGGLRNYTLTKINRFYETKWNLDPGTHLPNLQLRPSVQYNVDSRKVGRNRTKKRLTLDN